LELLEGIKKVMKNRDYILLVVNLGAGLAYFNTYYTTMEATLCSRGYDNVFAATCTSLLIGLGLIGATLAGIVVDKTKKFEEIFKICLCCCNLFGLLFNEFAIYPNYEPVIAIAVSGFGFFGIAYYAAGMEISAEITYPASETTSAGIVGLSGQLLGVIYITVWGLLVKPLPDQYRNMQKCTFSGQTLADDDFVEESTIVPQYLFVIVGTIIAMIGVIFFKPKYLRISLESKQKPGEEKSDTEKVINTTNGHTGKLEDIKF
jgi:FLVCR family MFS transporter 7